MNADMRVSILLACAVLASHGVRAEILSAADRETLLDNLAKLKGAADSRVDARFRVALAAFRNAIGSDDAAIELYLNCIERVNFQEEQKSAKDFREWKRQESEKLAAPGMRLALRHQLRWLILTLEAARPEPDRVKLGEEAGQIVEAIFRDPERLRGQTGLLGQSVTASVFARAYDINHLKVEHWPLSPIQLDSIYEEVLLPPLRNPSKLGYLREAWIKRIQHEVAKMEFWSPRPAEGKRGVSDPGEEAPEMLKFREATLPKLEWDMQVDLFRNGDESGAAMKMLQHLEKHISHPSAREWSEEFKGLLTPAVPPPATKPADEPTP